MAQVLGGPLVGLKIVEFAGIGPGPFAGMMLSDLGADVIRIDRANKEALLPSTPLEFMNRGRRTVMLDLKSPDDIDTARALIGRADALFEGFRPGVMEKLGLGPEPCLALNPRLVYGRITGWGQTGPLASAAGHDLNYLALSGALHAMGDADRPPTPPLNLVADFGGGGLLLAFGMVSALLSARETGVGQVVDAAMVDGCAAFTTMFYGLQRLGMWTHGRAQNLLDGAAHFYTCYACQDGQFISVAPIEPRFYAILLDKLGLDPEAWPQYPPDRWPELKRQMADIFKTQPRAHWCALLEGTDACVAPVLSMAEAAEHPHNRHRDVFPSLFGEKQPGPAPRFSGTPAAVSRPAAEASVAAQDILQEWSR